MKTHEQILAELVSRWPLSFEDLTRYIRTEVQESYNLGHADGKASERAEVEEAAHAGGWRA